MLGLGPDGHIASLFKPEDDKKEELVVATQAPNGLKRLSMTTQLINQARKKVLLPTGIEKGRWLKLFLEGKAKDAPVSLLERDKLFFFLDHEAARGTVK